MLRIGLECITTKALFVVAVSIQVDTDVFSGDADASVKKCRVLFSIRRASIDKSLHEANRLFGRLLFVDSMSCSEPMPNTLEMSALATCALYFGSTTYIALVEHPGRLACSTEVAWAQWIKSVKLTPRYAASALVAATAALVQGRAAVLSPWTWGSIFLLVV